MLTFIKQRKINIITKYSVDFNNTLKVYLLEKMLYVFQYIISNLHMDNNFYIYIIYCTHSFIYLSNNLLKIRYYMLKLKHSFW